MKSNLKVYIILISAMVIIGLYFFINYRMKKDYVPDYNLEDFYQMPERKMSVNEYKTVTISEEDMALTYFNTFIMMMFEETDKSYGYLNEDYREMKFGNVNEYRRYVSNITNNYTSIPKMKSYNIVKKNNKTIYRILDEFDNTYIFVSEAVMKYYVYFDENTIEIE